MLHSLKVRNVALIEELNIHFSEGLNVLTGETGAGKSILVDSLGVILGERVSSDLLRYGADELKVEGVFSIIPEGILKEKLQELDIPLEDDNTLIVMRKVTKAGKNTVLVNGWQVSVSSLKSIGRELVQVHAQHDTQEIFSSSFALETLDRVSEEIQKQRGIYQEKYLEWKRLTEEKEELLQEEESRQERLELISWQLKELTEAELDQEEEVKLAEYILTASNTGRIAENLQGAYQILNEEDSSVLVEISQAMKELASVSKYDKSLEPLFAELQECYYKVDEVCRTIRDYQSNLEFDPNEFEQKQKRMEKFHQLQKKYGLDMAGLIEKLEELTIEEERLNSSKSRLEALDKVLSETYAEMIFEGEKLTKIRVKVAEEWAKVVENSIRELAMPEARFVITVHSNGHWGMKGQDEVDFLFSANVGQPPQSMKRIASGGELSRIALAIQSLFLEDREERTMIFDEIDTGIGGQTALAVGRKMRRLSKRNQILSITHLPQIAVFAERQLLIEKIVKGERTFTEVRVVEEEERVNELARMLSGETNHQTAKEMAMEMLRQATE